MIEFETIRILNTKLVEKFGDIHKLQTPIHKLYDTLYELYWVHPIIAQLESTTDIIDNPIYKKLQNQYESKNNQSKARDDR